MTLMFLGSYITPGGAICHFISIQHEGESVRDMILKSLSLCQVALGAMQLCVFLAMGLISNWHSCIQLERWSVKDYSVASSDKLVLCLACPVVLYQLHLCWSGDCETLWLTIPCSNFCDADREGLNCILGKISSVKEWSNIETGWHFKWWNHHPWKHWNNA